MLKENFPFSIFNFQLPINDHQSSIDLTFDLWIQHMLHGEFEKAWEFSDCVLASGINRDYENTPRHFQCIWDGTPLHDKIVLVRCYHGLGDTIMFIRYMPILKKIAKKVIVWAQPELLDIIKTVEDIDMVIPLHEGSPDVEFDVDVEIMELPHIFRTTLSAIPVTAPYLKVEPQLLSKNDKLKVGLVWHAGDWNQSRNIPFSLLKPLLGIKEIEIYILQANARSAGWEEGYGIYPGSFKLYDFAKVIAGLDLLISVDSMPAHLAGALNVPVWLLLHENSDWRWMLKRSDSLWYPSMKLFRKESNENWAQIINKIRIELKRYIVR